MIASNKKTFIVYLSLISAILIILNIVSRNVFDRWDLTDNKMYSLSKSSKSVVKKIDDRLTMKIYFSDNLPGEYGNNRRYLQDMLEEYAAFSKGKIYFEFFKTDDDEKMQEDAQKSGIQPVQLQVIENDNIAVKRVYMGMVFLYEDKRESIPLIQTTTGLEYEITTKIKMLVNKNNATIAIAKSNSQTDIQNESINQILNQRYNVKNINIDEPISEQISLIILNGFEDSITVDEKNNLDAFINKGGNLLISQNRIKTDLSTQQATPIESNIFDWLKSYGLDIEKNLVLDLNCGKVNVQQNLGFLRIPVPMDYPFLPIIKQNNFNDEIIMVSGLEGLRLMFPSEIIINDSPHKIFTLFTSSNQSTTMQEFFNLNPDPNANPAFSQLKENGKALGAMAEINNNDIISNIILISDSNFLSDQGGGAAQENHIFLMNAIDYLLGDRELIALRSREITSRPLIELKDSQKSTWKWINILLPSCLIIFFGFLRLRNENNRSKLLRELYD